MTPLDRAGIDAVAKQLRMDDLGPEHCEREPWDAIGPEAQLSYKGYALKYITLYVNTAERVKYENCLASMQAGVERLAR